MKNVYSHRFVLKNSGNQKRNLMESVRSDIENHLHYAEMTS